MPASKLAAAGALFLVLTSLLGGFDNQPLANITFLPTATSAISSALQWLASNQSSSTGSYGDYFDHWTAAAAYALWLNNSRSPKAALSYSWLAVQLNSSSSWFWGQYGEADVPGAMLYSVAASQSANIIDVTGVTSRLVELQESNGGFRGYYDPSAGQYGQNVASTVDTAMALWGLAEAGTNPSSRQSAIEYLVSLQNSDGSFNLTRTTTSDPIYSHGPEPVSITALALLALKTASYTNDALVTKALDFLSMATSRNFTDSNTTTGHVYSASLTALALNAFRQTGEASEAVSFILSQQNLDGGFSDNIRSSGASNALDTGWAVISLQLVPTEPAPTGPSQGSPRPNPIVIAEVVASVVIPVAVILGLAVYYRRREKGSLTLT